VTAKAPEIVHLIADLRGAVGTWRRAGERVALVPTMGALHRGHLDLVRAGKVNADRVVVSIFVNPRQFAPHEDFGRYPRDVDGDRAKLASVGADLIWAPDAAEMYPDGFATRIEPAGAAEGLETEFRPHFFGGVTTVCCKLFSAATPDFATFGEKDYQQLCVIRQMVRDLNLPLAILPVPTAREGDGLALSSRNQYLSSAERAIAPRLYATLATAAAAVQSGTSPDAAETAARHEIAAAGFRQVDYVAVRDAETLGPWKPHRAGRVLAAAWLGQTRLIDNIGIAALPSRRNGQAEA
jgi:pantoate--beta-alanine ligase